MTETTRMRRARNAVGAKCQSEHNYWLAKTKLDESEAAVRRAIDHLLRNEPDAIAEEWVQHYAVQFGMRSVKSVTIKG